jgi:hypothetical protein
MAQDAVHDGHPSREVPHRVNGLSLYLLRQELNPRCLQSPVGVLVAIARPGAVTRGFWSAVRRVLRDTAGREQHAPTRGD